MFARYLFDSMPAPNELEFSKFLYPSNNVLNAQKIF